MLPKALPAVRSWWEQKSSDTQKKQLGWFRHATPCPPGQPWRTPLRTPKGGNEASSGLSDPPAGFRCWGCRTITQHPAAGAQKVKTGEARHKLLRDIVGCSPPGAGRCGVAEDLSLTQHHLPVNKCLQSQTPKLLSLVSTTPSRVTLSG